MVGISCHFLLSPAPAPLYSRHRPAAVRGGAHQPVKVRPQISCCSKPDDSEECSSNSPSDGKEEEIIPSRRKCLACLCAVTLISASGTPKGLASDMTNQPGTQNAVCRNCGGSGAVIFGYR